MQTSIVTKMTSLLDMFDRSGHNATTLNLTWDILPDHFKNEYVEVALAKEPYSVFSNVLMTCFYVVILVFGMVGNFMTLIVISWEKGTKSPANLFLISLSLADIITLLIVMPIEVLITWIPHKWILGTLACNLFAFVGEYSIYVSVMTMMTFTFERYTAVCYPLRPSLHSDVKRTRRILLGIWAVAAIPALAMTKYIKLHGVPYFDAGVDHIEEGLACSMGKANLDKGAVFLIGFGTFFVFVIPAVLFPMAYTRIYKAMNSSNILQPASQGSKQQNENRYIAVRMQIALIVTFLFCWLPYHIDRVVYLILTWTDSWTDTRHEFMNHYYLISGIFYYFNCVCNPCLYGLFSSRFRNGFKKLLSNFVCCGISADSLTTSQTSPSNLESQENIAIKDNEDDDEGVPSPRPRLMTLSTCTSSCANENSTQNRLTDFLVNCEIEQNCKNDLIVNYQKTNDFVSFFIGDGQVI